MVLRERLVGESLSQEGLSSVCKPFEAEAVQYAAHTLGDCLLLVAELLVDGRASLYLLELRLRGDALQSEQQSLQQAEVLRPLEGLREGLVEVKGFLKSQHLLITRVADCIASVLLLSIVSEYYIVY